MITLILFTVFVQVDRRREATLYIWAVQIRSSDVEQRTLLHNEDQSTSWTFLYVLYM